MNKKSIILLSGGVDSVVSLACARESYNIKLALTFNYGQKSFTKEEAAAKNIASFYGLEHKVITLDWLKDITTTSLVSDAELPNLDLSSLDNKVKAGETAKAVWVPNRNGLFVNIAACFADSQNYTNIIIGANKEEAATFKDNSQDFISAVNESFKNSVDQDDELLAPLINYNKTEIIKLGIEKNIPFQYIQSCYKNEEKHCGNCESCNRLKRALIQNHREDLIKLLF